MELTHAQLSIAGPVRPNNEDYVAFWRPEDSADERQRGSVVLLADGVGGHGKGEVASQLAVETALKAFREASPGTALNALLFQMFTAGNVAVYDAGIQDQAERRMATTLLAAIFRNSEVAVGHVGDSRAYLVQSGGIRRLTNDHSYVGMQLKLGLISEQEAMTSQFRNLLTRCVGHDPTVQVECVSAGVLAGDVLVICSDGLHAHVPAVEIYEIASRLAPGEACEELVARALKRGTDDNVSVHVVRVDRVEQVMYYRGLPIYHESNELNMSHEIEVGQILDERFHITEVISRSGMASIFKAKDLTTGKTVAIKAPFMQFESDPGFFARFQREEEIGLTLDHPLILHIVPVPEKSRPYIAMEYLEGNTLRQLLLRSVRPVPTEEAAKNRHARL